MTTLFRRAGVVLAGTALLAPFLLAAPAAAHVTATPNEANSPFFRTAFRVGHGCDGAATTTVRIQIPDGVTTARPEVVPGWEVEITPVETGEEEGDGHGSAVPVAEVAWVGGNLPDSQFQEFGLSVRIADDAPEVLYFPTIQECEEGEHRWIEIPDSVDGWGDLDEPAPYVINSTAGGGDHGATSDDEGEDEGEDAAEPGEAADEAEPVAAGDEGSGALPVVALIAGLLGLVAGLAALVVALRSSRRTSTS